MTESWACEYCGQNHNHKLANGLLCLKCPCCGAPRSRDSISGRDRLQDFWEREYEREASRYFYNADDTEAYAGDLVCYSTGQ